MKKIEKFIKSNIKLVVGIIIGILISGTAVFAATTALNSNQVDYDKSNSSLQSTTVKEALDALYTKSKNWIDPNNMGKPTNYIFDGENLPTTESPTTPPEGKNVYLGLYSDKGYGVCIKRNGKQHCFRYRNWVTEKEHIKNVFSDLIPWGGTDSIAYYGADVGCRLTSSGFIVCKDEIKKDYCFINADGEASAAEFAMCFENKN